MKLLKFQAQLVQTLLEEKEGLVILSPGLGLLTIVNQLITIYSNQLLSTTKLLNEPKQSIDKEEEQEVKGLVLLLNLEPVIIDLFRLGLGNVKHIDSSIPSQQRQELYQKGGVLSITSRILVVDMLSDKVPLPLVTGIMVLDAHKIKPHCVESFILRIYRQQNQEGFILAFTTYPTRYSYGFNTLENHLKLLYLRHTHLIPRFHHTITSELKSHSPNVTELKINLTKKMGVCQAAILDCLTTCLSELKRTKLFGDVIEELNIDNALSKGFDGFLRTQLDKEWQSLGYKTKELVMDIATLRTLLTYLTSYDGVTFLKFLDTIVKMGQPDPSNPLSNSISPWLLSDGANTLIQTARSRVYSESSKQPGIKEFDPILECQPKWKVCQNLINEIRHEYQVKDGSSHARILITTATARSSYQLKNYLNQPHVPLKGGSKKKVPIMMVNALNRYWKWKTVDNPIISNKPNDSNITNKRRRVRNNITTIGGSQTTLRNWQMDDDNNNNDDSRSNSTIIDTTSTKINEEDDLVEIDPLIDELPTFDPATFSQYFGLSKPEVTILEDRKLPCLEIMIHCTSLELDNLIMQNFKPTHIILLDPEPSFIRRIETYSCNLNDSNNKLEVYTLSYNDSVEEQRFLADIRLEKDSFERLIMSKAKVTVPVDYIKDEMNRANLNLIKGNRGDTRIAGGQISLEKASVIVDVREFRSTLPSILHQSGLTIIPATLTIGDYILSPTLCIERKSIPDLIQSLKSGRLFNQIETMSKYYLTPILLIESNNNNNNNSNENEFNMFKIHEKLALLVKALPKTKIIWSDGTNHCAEILSMLKRNKPEPDVEQSIRLGTVDSDLLNQVTNTAPMSLLQSLPYLTSNHIQSILKNVNSIRDLTQLSSLELKDLLGEEIALKLKDFFEGKIIL